MLSNKKPECFGTNRMRRDAYDMIIKINFTEVTEMSLELIPIHFGFSIRKRTFPIHKKRPTCFRKKFGLQCLF